MKLPSWLYRSERVGKNGKRFSLLKIRTLKVGFDGQFATKDSYTHFGKFLRRTKLDEIPQLLSVLRGDMRICGPRPENWESVELIPKSVRKTILSIKPGLTSLSSLHFFAEEDLLQTPDATYDYHARIKPIKLILDAFYVQHRGPTLDLWIIWRTAVLVLKSFFK